MERGPPEGVSIRTATTADHVAVSRILDGALLEHPDLAERLEAGTVLVATIDRTVDGMVVAALVVDAHCAGSTESMDRSPPAEWPDAAHVESIAVRRRHRRRGIGAGLVRAARRRWVPLTADFDERVEPFYESLGAECCEASDGRRWALLTDP